MFYGVTTNLDLLKSMYRAADSPPSTHITDAQLPLLNPIASHVDGKWPVLHIYNSPYNAGGQLSLLNPISPLGGVQWLVLHTCNSLLHHCWSSVSNVPHCSSCWWSVACIATNNVLVTHLWSAASIEPHSSLHWWSVACFSHLQYPLTPLVASYHYWTPLLSMLVVSSLYYAVLISLYTTGD